MKTDKGKVIKVKKNKIVDLNGLREHAVSILEKLDRKEIEVDEAGVVGKLCESVVSTVKVQLEYSKMVNKVPRISFLGNCTDEYIEQKPTKKFLTNK